MRYGFQRAIWKYRTLEFYDKIIKRFPKSTCKVFLRLRVSGGIEWNRKPGDLDEDENELDEFSASQRENNMEIYNMCVETTNRSITMLH